MRATNLIFDDVVPPEHVWPVDARWPIIRAQGLMARFQAKFPNLHYDVFWDTRLMNAQAFLAPKGRCVRLYGGLARHRWIGVEGLAFALAHETGHHLGGPPRHPAYSSISSEERANEWAVETGLLEVFGHNVGHRYASAGQSQLDALCRHYSIKSAIW
jgi:Zn-dependent protease with chaperone function